MTLSAGGPLRVDPTTLDQAAATLRDLAVDVQSGRLDRFLLDWIDAPSGQPDLAAALRRFVEFADDQYEDVVALLAALATRVAGAAATYAAADTRVATRLAQFLADSDYRPAAARPR